MKSDEDAWIVSERSDTSDAMHLGMEINDNGHTSDAKCLAELAA